MKTAARVHLYWILWLAFSSTPGMAAPSHDTTQAHRSTTTAVADWPSILTNDHQQHLGVCVQPIPPKNNGATPNARGSAQTVLEEPQCFQGDHPFEPASLTKLFTAVAALDWWQDHKFHWCSQWRYPAHPSATVDHIDLIMSGDPLLTSTELATSLATLHQMGIDHIRKLHIVHPLTTEIPLYGPGWMWDEIIGCHAAPIGDDLLDRGCQELTLDAKTSASSLAQTTAITGWRVILKETSPQTNITHWRRWQADATTAYYQKPALAYTTHERLSIRDPRGYLRQKLLWAAQRNGLHIDHIDWQSEETASIPQPTTLTICHNNLDTYLHAMLWKSDNTVSEALARHLAIEVSGHHDWTTISSVIADLIEKHHGIDIHGQLVDGSGLSRYDTLTARQVSTLLSAIDQTPYLHTKLLTKLPRVGQEGSVANTLTSSPLAGHGRAKSGGMRGGQHLAGFISGWPGHSDLQFVWLSTHMARADSVVNTAGPVKHHDNDTLRQFFQALYDHGYTTD